MLVYIIGILQSNDVEKAKQLNARVNQNGGTFATNTSDPRLSMYNTYGYRVYSLLHNEVKDLTKEAVGALIGTGSVVLTHSESANITDQEDSSIPEYGLYNMGLPLIIDGVVKARQKRFVLGKMGDRYLCYNASKKALYTRSADELLKSDANDKTPYLNIGLIDVDINEINPGLRAKIQDEIEQAKNAVAGQSTVDNTITGIQGIQNVYGKLRDEPASMLEEMRNLLVNEQQTKPLGAETVEVVPKLPNVKQVIQSNKGKAISLDKVIKHDINEEAKVNATFAGRKIVLAEKPTLLPGQIYCDKITVKEAKGRETVDKVLTVQQAMSYAAKMLQAIDPYLYILFTKFKKVAVTDADNKENVGTLGVTVDTFYYNIDHVATLTMGQLVFVLLHELYHIFMKHPQRGRKKDAWVWNIACDLIVNGNLVKNYRLDLMKGEQVFRGNYKDKEVLIPIGVRPGNVYHPLIDVSKTTTEQVYAELMEEVKKELQQQQQSGQGSGQQQQSGNQSGQQSQPQSGGQQSSGDQQQSGQQQSSGGQQQQSSGGQQSGGQESGGQQSGQESGNQGAGQQSQGNGQDANENSSNDGSNAGNSGQQGNEQGNGQGNEQSNGQGNEQDNGQGNEQDNGQGNEQGNGQGDNGLGNDDVMDGVNQGDKEIQNPFSDRDEINRQSNNANKQKSMAPGVTRDENGDIQSVTINYKGQAFTINYSDLDVVEDDETIDKSDDEINEIANRKYAEVKESLKQFSGTSNSTMLRNAEESEPIRDILWERFLKKYLNEATKNKKSFRNPSRKFIPSGIILKGRIKADKDAIKGIYFCVDTSASISDLELGLVFGIITGTLQKYGVKGKVLYWDTAVKAVGEFENVRELLVARKMLKGGGGTSPECVFNYFNSKECKDKPELVVMLTDGCFGAMKDVSSRRYGDILWIITDSKASYDNFKPPFGKKAPMSYYS